MKTTIIIFAIFFSQISVLFAGAIEDYDSNPLSPKPISIESTTLSPSIPMEATFTDTIEADLQMSELIPVVPTEADFVDTDNQPKDHSKLAPTIPEEADFEELD